MAGIGFELRKIYGKNTLVSKIAGSVYATMATIGPTVLFMLLLFLIIFTMNFYHIEEMDKLFFTSSFTYLFLVAILISAVHNTVVSRYISDKIYEKKEEDISSAVYGCLITGTVCASVSMLVLCVYLYGNGMTDIRFLFVYYLLGIFATNAYNLLIFVSALKEYKKITISYFIGLFMSIPLFLLLINLTELSLVQCGYVAVCLAFFLINLFLIYSCIKAFDLPKGKMFDFIGYFKEYPALLITSIAYMTGFYISNIIYWNFGENTAIVYGLKTMPIYDLALFFAIIINMPALVIFVVKTETEFYDKYVAYLSALANGSYVRMEKARESLQNTLQTQLFYVYEVQLIVTIIAICVVIILSPYFMLSDTTVSLFAVLGMGVYCLFSMYFTIIMLYYFEDYQGTAIAAVSFLTVVVGTSFLCTKVGVDYYAIPVLAGSIVGWIISFIQLRQRMKNLNSYMLCK